jgi:hypothetical protein
MFKRNQIEEALARVIQPGTATLNSQTAGRVKRLLELDRARGRNKRSQDPAKSNFAFHRVESPGRGHDNPYSEYEVFAVLIGVKLMQHGLSQRGVVGLLRRLRPELEWHHARILRENPSSLFDEASLMRARVKPGQMAVNNTDPTFIVVYSEQGRKESMSVAICRGERELSELYHRCGPGYAFTLIELVNFAHALSAALARATPQKRGRASRKAQTRGAPNVKKVT